MKVLVTGANGFLGSHIVRKLIEKGYSVKAFILEGTSTDIIKDLKFETFKGNLLNPKDIEEALKSCDYVIHTAAITDVWPKKNPLSWKINYEVVKNLSFAVKKNQIKKYIHIGTANSFGFGTINNPGTEESEYNCGKFGLDYIESKKAAQDYLLEEAKNGLQVVIINPTFMIGENDSKPGPGEMIISVIEGKVPGYAVGGRCFAAVKDVASATINALEKGKIGECYIIGGKNLCYKDFFALIAKVAQVKAPKLKIPTFIAKIFARFMELIAFIKRKKPRLTHTMAKISGEGNYYSSKKAIKDLDLKHTDLEIALKEAIDWYEANGYIVGGLHHEKL